MADERAVDPDATPDEVLARRAGMGDRRAFTVLFERHGPATFRYAVHMLDGRTQDAEDVVQSAWTKAWLSIEGFRGEARFRTWMFGITANEVRQSRRRSRPVLVEDDLLVRRPDDGRHDPHRHLEGLELHQTLELALAELPWRQRAAWIMRELDGLSYGEIAEALGTNPTVVRGQLHRARQTLAVRMAQWR